MSVKKVLVSIILPTYNWKSEWLIESINSVLNQTYNNFELIIINDCSTNNIEKIIEEYEKKDPRIVYVKNEKNLKLTRTLNKWISIANGKYIARIDDDDIWNDGRKLERQVDFMESNGDYWLCWVENIIRINEKWNIIEEFKHKTEDKDIKNMILKWCPFAHSSVLIRKSILNKVWVYDPVYNKAEDYELWCRIWVHTKLKNINDSSIKYRINLNGVSKKNRIYQKFLSLKICFKYRKYYPWFFVAFFFRVIEIIFPKKFIVFAGKIIRKYFF